MRAVGLELLLGECRFIALGLVVICTLDGTLIPSHGVAAPFGSKSQLHTSVAHQSSCTALLLLEVLDLLLVEVPFVALRLIVMGMSDGTLIFGSLLTFLADQLVKRSMCLLNVLQELPIEELVPAGVSTHAVVSFQPSARIRTVDLFLTLSSPVIVVFYVFSKFGNK